MNEIIPVGILARNSDFSDEFYKKVLKIESVFVVKNTKDHALMRLESPRIQILSTTIRILDRPDKHFVKEHKRLQLFSENVGQLIASLKRNKVKVFGQSGQWFFTDLNGIEWVIGEPRRLMQAA